MDSPPAANIPSNQQFSPNVIDSCFALVAYQATIKPSNQTRQPCIFPNSVDIWFALWGKHCILPRTPSRLYLYNIHPSIHPSTKHTHRKKYKSIKHYITQSINNKETKQPTHKKNTFFSLPMIHPLLSVLSPNPSNQQAKQAEPTNTSIEGSGVKNKGWIAHQITSKPSDQTVFSPNVIDICLALVIHQLFNKPSNQRHTTLYFLQRPSIFDLHYNKLVNQPTHQQKKGG